MAKKSKLESHFKEIVKRRLGVISGLYFFVKEALALRGIPDIIGCYKGHFFAWELKRSEAEAKKKSGRIVLQKYILSKINSAGGIGRIVYPENLEESIRELLDL